MFDTKISLYGILIIMAFICGLFVFYKNAKRLNFKKEEMTGLLLFILVGAMFGAKYYTFFANPERYNNIFVFKNVGLSSYGAVIGILILLIIFSILFKKSFKNIIYSFLPSVPLMYGIGKIGCFISGCCYGIEYNGPFKVIYNYSQSAPKGISLFPIQLVEAIVFIIIFFISNKMVKNNKSNNKTIGFVLIMCGLAKFLLDYLRMSHVGVILSLNQIVSLLFIIIGIVLLIIKDHKKAQ